MRQVQFALDPSGSFVYPDTASLFSEVEIDVQRLLVHATYAGSKPLAASTRQSSVFRDTSTLGLTEIVIDDGGGAVTIEEVTDIVERVVADSGVAVVGKYEQSVSFPAGGGSMIITHNRNTLASSCMLYDNTGNEYSATVTEATVNSFRLTTTAAFIGKIVCSF